MRAFVILWSLLVMAAVVSSKPNRSLGRRPAARRPNTPPASTPLDSKTNPEPSTPQGDSAGTEGTDRPSVPTSSTTTRFGPRPRRPRPTSRPSSTTSTTVNSTEAARETTTEAVTEEVTEVREVGVNGWLAAPTLAPASPLARTEAPPKPDKAGLCETAKGFGVKCMTRVDQCMVDHECPGATKCCMVGECGYLCVKPKPTSTEAKQPTKTTVKKTKGGVKDREAEEEAEERTIEEETDQKAEEEESVGGNTQQKTDDDGEGGLASTTTTSAAATTTTTTTRTSDIEKDTEATLESPTLP